MTCEWCGRSEGVVLVRVDDEALPSFETQLCEVCQVLLRVGAAAQPSETQIDWARSRVFRQLTAGSRRSGVPSLRCPHCAATIPLDRVRSNDEGERFVTCPGCRQRIALAPSSPRTT